MIKFIKHHVLYRFGVPRRIIHDNGPQFVSQAFQSLCNKFRIQCVSSMSYYPAANGLIEAFNKTIGKLLNKFVLKSQRVWDDKLGEGLRAYCTTVRTPTKPRYFSWCMDVKLYSHWRSKSHPCELPWQPRWQMMRSIDYVSRSWKL